MASRLLRSKGVGEFISAAKDCRHDCPGAKFVLVGEAQKDHLDAYPMDKILSATQSGIIEYQGYRTDLDRFIGQVDLVILPSYYREGVPRILQEAAACGVPCITTDTPGCREAVVDGVTGYLVPPRDAKALSAAIQKFLENGHLSAEMGRAARQFACEKFDIRQIAQNYLSLYEDVLGNI
jgi:glycosyltransferase involved in cell wall biosynthesis